MSFKPGDRFRVKENGITGQIVSIDNSSGEPWYTVLWDTLSRSGAYPAREVEDIWELTHTSITVKIPSAVEFVPISLTIHRGASIACEHEWRQYFGFNDSYDYCSKCDQKRRMS